MSDYLRKGISNLDDGKLQALYTQSSEWARHYHAGVWTAFALGVSVALGGLTFFRNSDWLEFMIAGFVCVALLFLSNRFADAVRVQWENYMAIINLIEVQWQLRNSSLNARGPLALESAPAKAGRTMAARKLFVKATVLTWILAVLVKVVQKLW